MADYSINKGSYVSVYVGICQSQSRLVAEVNHLDYPAIAATKYDVRRGTWTEEITMLALSSGSSERSG